MREIMNVICGPTVLGNDHYGFIGDLMTCPGITVTEFGRWRNKITGETGKTYLIVGNRFAQVLAKLRIRKYYPKDEKMVYKVID
jgi:ABC-type hemin transport system substrate-binding protein